MDFRIRDKVALITATSKGLGHGSALARGSRSAGPAGPAPRLTRPTGLSTLTNPG